MPLANYEIIPLSIIACVTRLAFELCNPRPDRPIIDRSFALATKRSANENAPKFNSQPHGNNELRLVGKTALAGIQVAVGFVQFGIAGSLFL